MFKARNKMQGHKIAKSHWCVKFQDGPSSRDSWWNAVQWVYHWGLAMVGNQVNQNRVPKLVVEGWCFFCSAIWDHEILKITLNSNFPTRYMIFAYPKKNENRLAWSLAESAKIFEQQIPLDPKLTFLNHWKSKLLNPKPPKKSRMSLDSRDHFFKGTAFLKKISFVILRNTRERFWGSNSVTINATLLEKKLRHLKT